MLQAIKSIFRSLHSLYCRSHNEKVNREASDALGKKKDKMIPTLIFQKQRFFKQILIFNNYSIVRNSRAVLADGSE